MLHTQSITSSLTLIVAGQSIVLEGSNEFFSSIEALNTHVFVNVYTSLLPGVGNGLPSHHERIDKLIQAGRKFAEKVTLPQTLIDVGLKTIVLQLGDSYSQLLLHPSPFVVLVSSHCSLH
jgi:hypothetical protein